MPVWADLRNIGVRQLRKTVWCTVATFVAVKERQDKVGLRHRGTLRPDLHRLGNGSPAQPHRPQSSRPGQSLPPSAPHLGVDDTRWLWLSAVDFGVAASRTRKTCRHPRRLHHQVMSNREHGSMTCIICLHRRQGTSSPVSRLYSADVVAQLIVKVRCARSFNSSLG